MSLNHYMSDYIARVNNAVTAKNPIVSVLKSKLTTEVTKKLTSLGYFKEFSETERTIEITLTAKINKLKVISKPGQRVYVGTKELPKVIGGMGFNILSTSKGVLAGHEAKKDNLGGELLFQIY